MVMLHFCLVGRADPLMATRPQFPSRAHHSDQRGTRRFGDGDAALTRQGVLLVVSGPSGAGKGTIIGGLMARHGGMRKSVSCTTRGPRPGERDGESYHFIATHDFARMRDGGEFLEWATVHGDLSYGTPRAPVEQAPGQAAWQWALFCLLSRAG